MPSEDVVVVGVDGLKLAGRLYKGEDVGPLPKLVVLVNSGAGLVQNYYRGFAEFLGDWGIPTLTYDYRGIGASAPADLRGFAASVEDWGSKDCAAALAWLVSRFPQSRLALIGHSVGAIVTGFVTNGPPIDKMLLIGGHTGYWKDYQGSLRIPMFVLWHVAMPRVAKCLGYFPARAFGMADLPLGVALQWAQRRRAELWWDVEDPNKVEALKRGFASIRATMLVMRFRNDAFASEKASQRLKALYPNCPADDWVVEAKRLGLRGGHFGFFRRQSVGLWREAARWLSV